MLKHRSLDPTPRISDSLGLGWDMIICVSNKFLGDTDAAGLHFETHGPRG